MRSSDQFINEAYALFDEFYSELTPLRQKCIANDEFWKTNHWHDIAMAEASEPRPVTPVLFSTLESLLSDIMDSYPEAVILPEEEGDEQLAKSLGDIIKYILKRRNYKTTYRNKCRAALKKGTSVQEVFWDRDLYNGLGDVNIRNWDIKNFLFDPDCENIQDGRACFKFAFYPKEYFLTNYPGTWEQMKPDNYAVDYQSRDIKDNALLIEYWYKTADNGVHMAKLAGGVLLEHSEKSAPNGMYEHGMYPFIVEPLFPLDGQPVGFGLIDLLKNLQQYADKLDQIILKNALMSGKVKLLVNKNADLDESALTDWSQEVIRGSRIDDSSVRWFQPAPLNPYVLHHFNGKLSAIKEESGQNQFVRGETLNGVTAASAIMALQEAGSKRSRLLIDAMYDGFEQLIRMIIEVVKENYTEERRVLINGNATIMSSDMLKKNILDKTMPVDFDVSVTAQRQTPYRTNYQNDFAILLLKSGIVNTHEALSLMTFDGKDKIMKSVQSRFDSETQKKLDSAQQILSKEDTSGI